MGIRQVGASIAFWVLGLGVFMASSSDEHGLTD
jgi:hypothetical protein